MKSRSDKLQEKEYRDAFVNSLLNIQLPFQIRALREARSWRQSDLAAKADMKQSRISKLEKPGEGGINLDTLIRLASAFDIGLLVKFASFKEIVAWSETFNPDTFTVPSYHDEDFHINESTTSYESANRGACFFFISRNFTAPRPYTMITT